MPGMDSGSIENSSDSRSDLFFHLRWNSMADILPGVVGAFGFARGADAAGAVGEGEEPKLSAEAVFLAVALVVGAAEGRFDADAGLAGCVMRAIAEAGDVKVFD